MLMKSCRFIVTVLLLTVLFAFDTKAEGDSTRSDVVLDPAANRLFMMSTGKISEPHRFSVGLFDFLVLQTGYSPTDFLQFNLSGMFDYWQARVFYWSVGAKAQLFQSSGFVHGIAVGADIGLFPHTEGLAGEGNLQSLNVGASLGGERVELHINAVALLQENRSDATTLLQTGVSVLVSQGSKHSLKLMAESWFVKEPHNQSIEFAFITAGFRGVGRGFVGEAAVVLGPRFFFGSYVVFPLLSFMWFI
jgi:hypothetical protein